MNNTIDYVIGAGASIIVFAIIMWIKVKINNAMGGCRDCDNDYIISLRDSRY